MTKLDRELKEVGCPYRANDERAKVWLAGYRACIQASLKQYAA